MVARDRVTTILSNWRGGWVRDQLAESGIDIESAQSISAHRARHRTGTNEGSRILEQAAAVHHVGLGDDRGLLSGNRLGSR